MDQNHVEKPFSGPGRKKKLTMPEAIAVFSLLLLTGGVLCAALFMAARNRVVKILLDPYAELIVEGADGYGRAYARFDNERFRQELEEKMLSARTSLTEEEIHELAEKTAQEARFDYFTENIEMDSAKDNKTPYVENISNGDTVTLIVSIDEETQSMLREKGFSLLFDCNPLEVTVCDLPEAQPYDPFKELNVSFSGFDGNGDVSFIYNGQYPITFSCKPEKNLHNGETVLVEGNFSSGYTMRDFVSEYHVVPSTLEREYVVSGLLINPTSIDDFTVDILHEISEHARTTAMILIKEEYADGEIIELLENAGMFYAYSREAGDGSDSESGKDTKDTVSGESGSGEDGGSSDGSGSGEDGGSPGESVSGENGESSAGSASGENGESSAGSASGENGESSAGSASGDSPLNSENQEMDGKNFLVCAFSVKYANEKGKKMKYYYYIRYDDLVLDEDGRLITDFTRVRHPEKSSTPIELIFGEGDDVSLPGLLDFKIFAGFKSLDNLYEKAVAPYENKYEISSLIQP